MSLVREFGRFHGMWHHKEVWAAEVEAFLKMLATERKVLPSLYRESACWDKRLRCCDYQVTAIS